MNHISITIILLLLIVLLPPGLAEKPTVIITDYSVSPDILTPGDIGTITVTVTNTAAQATKTASSSQGTGDNAESETVTVPVNAFIESVSLKTKEFEILNGWYEDIGEIGPGQSTPLTFLVRAPATEGVFFPEVWIRIRDGGSVKYPILVNVNTRYALSKEPMIQVFRSVPDQVIPGDLFNISLVLTNKGLSRAHEIIASVETPNRSISALSPERVYVGSLNPDESAPVNLSFLTDSKIPIGIQQFPVTINYMGADGSRQIQTAKIGVLIRGKAEVGIAKILIDPIRIVSGTAFTMIIRVENTGTDDAKSVRASLDIPFDGARETFIGTIEPNNDAPAVYNLIAGKGGDYPYTLTLAYHDDWGQHIDTIPLKISVEEKGGTDGILIFVLIIIAAGGGYLYWRRRST